VQSCDLSGLGSHLAAALRLDARDLRFTTAAWVAAEASATLFGRVPAQCATVGGDERDEEALIHGVLVSRELGLSSRRRGGHNASE
jgi:hypothetical protein